MSEARTLNVSSDICGRRARVARTFETAGIVTDVIVHPTEGRLLGFVLRGRAGSARRIAANRLSIGEQLVTSPESAFTDDDAGHLAHGAAARGELLGAGVVTDEGQLLGRVAEVHVSASGGGIFYTVAPSGFPGFFAAPFRLPGDLPHAYSASGKRLFVSVAAAEEARAHGIAGIHAGALWRRAGMAEAARAFVARHGVMLWLTLTALLLGGMMCL